MNLGLSLIIFDCDGVLVDSEPIANRVFAEQLGLHGMPMTVEDVVLHFIGSTRDMCIEKAGVMRGEPLPATFAKEWDDALQAALTGSKEPAQAMKDAQAEAARILRSYK